MLHFTLFLILRRSLIGSLFFSLLGAIRRKLHTGYSLMGQPIEIVLNGGVRYKGGISYTSATTKPSLLFGAKKFPLTCAIYQ